MTTYIDFQSIITRTAEIRPLSIIIIIIIIIIAVVCDKDYDSEKNHVLVREKV
jgi:t-SNARE complex subunit (syntaxin)